MAKQSLTRRRAVTAKSRPLAGAGAHASTPTRGKSAKTKVIAKAASPTRIPGLDALRGLAIVAMVAYHFCFDLRYFGVTQSDFEHDLRWLAARTLILSSFLLIAGISAVLARGQAFPFTHWLRHIGIIVAAAVLVSAASWLMFPGSFIWFGVLHAIALSLLLAKPLLRRPIPAAIIGMGVIVIGLTYANPLFDNRILGWIGFMTGKPITEDYVPLFPWAGVLLVGVTLGHALVRSRFAALAPLARAPAPLRSLGRHSLIVYLLHQPLLIGLLWLATRR
jgi:uncharacterized membrane protein